MPESDFEIRDGVVFITKNGVRCKADFQEAAQQEAAQKEAALKLLQKKKRK